MPRRKSSPHVYSVDTLSVSGGVSYPVPTSTQAVPRRTRPIQARYDAANNADVTQQRHWANASNLAADALQDPATRRKLRNNARYEFINNSYLQGIILSLSNDVVGVSPRIQLQSGDPEADRYVETELTSWMEASQLSEKLRTMIKSKKVDGEAFALFSTNPFLNHEVQLDLRLIEADQISTPNLFTPKPFQVDGVRFDEFGNPVSFDVLKHHPGEPYALGNFSYETIPASEMIHLFRVDRPGQVRGIPEITPALNLFAQLRRFTLATLSAAEIAAQINLVLESDTPADPDSEESVSATPFEVIPFARDAMVALPSGFKLSQVDSKHPTQAYETFKIQLLLEIARCLSIPKNIALGDSSGYNYSSARMDHRLYFKSVDIERNLIRSKVLCSLLRKWFEEARLIPGYLPDTYRDPSHKFGYQWLFDAPVSIDPSKDISSNAEALATGQITYNEIYANRGLDFETAVRQRAREEALLKELGLNFSKETLAPATAPNNSISDSIQEGENE